MDPCMLNTDARDQVTGGYYRIMKKIAKVSNQNLVRNSDAFISSGGKIDPDNEFCWIDDSYKTSKEKFQLTYWFFRIGYDMAAYLTIAATRHFWLY